MAIEFIRNFMDANPDAGKPTSLTTPIHEPKPITLVTPIADQHEFREGFDPALEEFARGLVEGFEAYDGLRITSFTKDNPIIDRELNPEDLGLKGQLEELRGNFSINDRQAKVRIDYIESRGSNVKEAIDSLSRLAKSHGAETLTIEGTFANDKFYRVLPRWYKVTTEGANDFIVIKLD